MDARPIEFLELLNARVQYVMPPWQRRYCWEERHIVRLVEDLVSTAHTNKRHYGGALLTFNERQGEKLQKVGSEVVTTIQIVDGQQRLTTISILLAYIAKELAPEGECDGWTAEWIHDNLLRNPKDTGESSWKLQLQNPDDNEEYRSCLEDRSPRRGAIAEAWETVSYLVTENRNGLKDLISGIKRLDAVNIRLHETDDQQQVFESLNATGLPLEESDKVRNWLLMSVLGDKSQRKIYEDWRQIERALGNDHTADAINTFLKDVISWRARNVPKKDRIYSGLQRWMNQQNPARDRAELCRKLARYAMLYGILTGTVDLYTTLTDAEEEPLDGRVASAVMRLNEEIRHLRHLHEMTKGKLNHYPLALRILCDSKNRIQRAKIENADEGFVETLEDLAKAFVAIGSWITRLCLAGRSISNLEDAIIKLAHDARVPDESEGLGEYWKGRICRCRIRNTELGVPSCEEVRQGILTRNVYSSGLARAILYALMEADKEQRRPLACFCGENQLEVEHIIPQNPPDEQKRILDGENQPNFHRDWKDKFANLTLLESKINGKLSNEKFAVKLDKYHESKVAMTNRIARLAEEAEGTAKWDRSALEGRSKDLTKLVLERWPWTDDGNSGFDCANENWICESWQFLKNFDSEKDLLDIQETKSPYNDRDLWTRVRNTNGDTVCIKLQKEKEVQLRVQVTGDKYGNDTVRMRRDTARMRRCSREIRMLMRGQLINEDVQRDSRNQPDEKKARSIAIELPWFRDEIDTWENAARWIMDQIEPLRSILNAIKEDFPVDREPAE